MMKRIASLILLFSPAFAEACECSFSSLDDVTVREAKSIFVFQLVSAELVSDGDIPPISRDLRAKMKVVEEIVGEPPGEEMAYSTLWCCGTRLNVGHYYAAILSKPTSPFRGHSGNLLHMGETYRPESSEARRLKAVVAGEKSLEAVYGEFPSSELEIVQPPPPPCLPSGR